MLPSGPIVRIRIIVVAGGVSANQELRKAFPDAFFPEPQFSGDNGAMVAGLGYRYIADGIRSDYDLTASARVSAFKKSWEKEKYY